MSFRRCALSLAAVTAALVLVPRDAEACGGTFCDAGPVSMPVDQTGENILFVMQEGQVEAQVQIQYKGDPDSFAWVVPVMATPEIEVGSELLFRELLAATVPTFSVTNDADNCGGRGPALGCGGDAATLEAGRADDAGGSEFDPDLGGPQVRKGLAGAFEYAVLEGGSTEAVVQWLDDNGYAQDDEAPALLDAYREAGFQFVAFKLRGGAGIDEIHPIVIRYAGDEPCVPIRLTRIAAAEDMGVRAFFLGEDRVVPTNYRSVEINPEAIDWITPGANYLSVVTQAVDAPGSDGHGFVTEYAGASSVVAAERVLLESWDASRFVELRPADAVVELEAQGFFVCDFDGCSGAHPLIEGLLEEFIPRPEGLSLEELLNCPGCYAEALGDDDWSGTLFAERLEERIIAPAEHAVDVLEGAPYLTRLFTTLSPHEMTVDPIFAPHAQLGDVSNMISATRVSPCDGVSYMEFADGNQLALAFDGVEAQLAPALRITEYPDAAAPMTVMDATEDNDAAREAWNAEQGLSDGSGCNCRARRHGAAGWGWILATLALGWRMRRPERRAS